MKIAILGAGAMGMLIGGYLSRANEVVLVDVNEAAVRRINAYGVTIEEKDGSRQVVRPRALVDSSTYGPAELVIVFVKAMYSEQALAQNRGLIGADTCLMTLQNGMGHEQTLLRFADEGHIVIGTTQHNSSVSEPGLVYHGGSGHTYIGCLSGESARLEKIARAFCAGGINTSVDPGVKRMIWNKLFTNASASVLTGVLQCPLGFVAQNPNAWSICERLVEEAAAVAEAQGIPVDRKETLSAVRAVCLNAPNGYTSIYMDLKNRRRSEVDTISGAVVRAGIHSGVPAPAHAMMVSLVHALEDLSETRKKESEGEK